MEEPKGRISQDLNEIKTALNIKQGEKDVKLPLKVRLAQKTIAKKNTVQVVYLRTNQNMEFKVCPIINGAVIIDKKKIHTASSDFIYLYKGKVPTLIVPEWSLIPIGTKEFYDAVKNKQIADPQTIIIRALEAAEAINAKKPFKISIILIILAIAAGGYILFGGQK